MRWTAWIGAAVAAAMTGGPAAAEVLHLDGIFAAKARDASLLPTIAVGPFGGRDGEELAEAIERRLAEPDADGTPHAQLIAPSLRPDGLLTGTASTSVAHDDYVETRERCTEKKDGKCVAKTRYRVRCTRRTIGLSADLRLVRRSDGRPLYAAPKSRDDSTSWCEDEGSGFSAEATVDGMIESIAREVRLDLMPHRERYKVRVNEDRDGLPPAAADRFRQAVRLTKTDEHAACAAFADVDRMVPDHGPTMFNLALCDEAAHRFAEAGDRYLRVRLLAPKEHGGDVSKGLGRAESLAAGEADVRLMAAR